jgi:hypothetical protein
MRALRDCGSIVVTQQATGFDLSLVFVGCHFSVFERTRGWPGEDKDRNGALIAETV